MMMMMMMIPGTGLGMRHLWELYIFVLQNSLSEFPEQSDRVREEPEIVMGLGVGANRLASNFKTPPVLAISNLAVYRAP